MTDILTYQNDFTDFVFSWKYYITNSGPYNDRRMIYFRCSQADSPDQTGYAIYVGMNTPEDPQYYVSLTGYTENIYFNWQVNTWYNFELEANGYNFKLKIWEDGTLKPDTYIFDVTDTTQKSSSGSIVFGNFMEAGTYVDDVLLQTLETTIPEPLTILSFLAACFARWITKKR